MKSITQLVFLVLAIVMIFDCRSDELKTGAAGDVLRNPLTALFSLAGFSGGSGSGTPRKLKVEDNTILLYGYADNSARLYVSTDGSNFDKRTFTFPSCTPSTGNVGSQQTACSIVAISKSGANYFAIGLKTVSTVVQNASPTIVSSQFYYAQGALDALNFVEIPSANIQSNNTSGDYDAYSSATDGTNFIFTYRQDNGATTKRCGSSNAGGTWVCEASNNSSAQNLSGTLVVGGGSRWNGAGFTATGFGPGGPFSVNAGRTFISNGVSISYTIAAVGTWSGGTAVTAATTIPGGIGNSSYIDIFQSNPVAVFSLFSGNSSIYRTVNSADNGANYSVLGSNPIAFSGFTSNVQLGGFAVLGSQMYYEISGNVSSNNFATKHFKTTDSTNFSEINL